MTHQTPFDGPELEADQETVIRMRDFDPSGWTPAQNTPLDSRVGSLPLSSPPPPPPRAMASRTDADAYAFVMAPDLPAAGSEQLATPTRHPQVALRWLPLCVGVVIGLLLSSLALAALQTQVVALQLPETLALGSAMAADEGLRTADFEITPSAVVSEGSQGTESAHKQMVRPAPARPSVDDKVSEPSEGNLLALLESKLRACAPGQHGTARLDLTVQPSGLISHAVVYGQFEGPEGSCMAKAARGLHLPSPQESARVVHRSFSW